MLFHTWAVSAKPDKLGGMNGRTVENAKRAATILSLSFAVTTWYLNGKSSETGRMRYLTLSELIYINGKVLNNPQILSGKQKIRDLALLEAAVARPAASAFGE